MSTLPLAYPAVYAAPASPPAYGPSPQSINVLRKFAQGAGSALLMFSGADSMTNSANVSGSVLPAVDFSSIEGIAHSLATGGLNGPFQIIAAIFLFLAAGRCIARFAGLLIVSAVVILYMQGVTAPEVISFFGRFADRLGAAAAAFQSA